MKLNSSEKSSIAWFKLSEFVMRGEKERALTIYRLLMHSIGDEAVAAQLKGDILSYFSDTDAVHAYCQSAELHNKNNNIFHALESYREALTLLLDTYKYDKVDEFIEAIELLKKEKALLYMHCVVYCLMNHEKPNNSFLKKYSKHVISHASDQEITRFTAKLKALDEQLYAFVCSCLAN